MLLLANWEMNFSYFQICQETAARDGLMKMKQVYEGNPALGDPMSIQGQLTENEKRLTTLQSEKKKFQASLVQLGLWVRSRPSRWSRVTVGFTRL